MANFNYHPTKESTKKETTKFFNFHTLEYEEPDVKKYKKLGWKECKKHPGVYYDDKEYDGCFLCNFPNKCKYCGKPAKRGFETCYNCYIKYVKNAENK